MKFLLQMLLLPTLLLAQQQPGMQLSSKPVNFLVIDPAGNPIENAFVEASRHAPGNATGRTGQDGRLELQLTEGATLHVYVSKDGYYTTGGELWTGGMYRNTDGKLVARELPETFTITLKKVIDPVELIHVQYRGRLPAIDKPIGFDLEKGDWVSPYGSGSVSDMLFYPEEDSTESEVRQSTLNLMFPKQEDGIQAFDAARPFSMEFGSNQAPPNRAPLTGYEAVLSKSFSHDDPVSRKSGHERRKNYIVRTRTRTDAAGVIRQACYGWIQGEIEFDPRGPGYPQIAFTSFFNPNPDPDSRSLENIRFVPRKR